MEIGDLLDKLEEDSKNFLITTALCFPVAYLDCWKISAHFSEIDLFPQIILSVAIASLLAIAGIMFNLFYLVVSKMLTQPLVPFLSIIPCYVTSGVLIILDREITPLSFEFLFVGFCLIVLARALFSRITKERKEKKTANNDDDNPNDI